VSFPLRPVIEPGAMLACAAREHGPTRSERAPLRLGLCPLVGPLRIFGGVWLGEG